ncbi:MAG: GNAT family N-acetyltransferase [Patescibacteria group bacterium]
MNYLLKYKKVTKQNIDTAIKIQNIIFPEENGAKNLIDSLGKHEYRKELCWWIAFLNEKPIGIVGLYSYHEYPDDAFMGWYGVIPNERQKGFGGKLFDFFEKKAKQKNYKHIRLYTDDLENLEATKLYYKKGMISEEYLNEDDKIDSKGKILIFSKSLTKKPTEKWNNKYLGLTKQVERQNYSIEDNF